jgi:hypothetical protein
MTGVADIEQFSIFIRYFDSKTKIVKELFLKCVPVVDLCGSTLASTIIKELTDMKIEVQYLRGQGYDGAASMCGQFNGIQICIRVKKYYKTAIYYISIYILYSCFGFIISIAVHTV